MHLCVFNHQSPRFSDGLHNLILRLPARLYSGLVVEATSTPIEFTPAFWIIWHLTIGLFVFTRCIPISWIFVCTGFSLLSNLDILLRGLLCYWGFFALSMSLTFSEWVPNLSANFSNRAHAIWLVCPIRFLWGYLLLLSCLWLYGRLSGGILFGSSCMSFSSLWWQGIKKCWRDCLQGVFQYLGYLFALA